MSYGIYKNNDGRRPSEQYNRVGVTQPAAAVRQVFPSATAMAPASHATWVTGPLQKEPPKEFVPQLLDPEPAYQKPAPDAIPDRQPVYPMQEDDAFKAFQKVDEHAMAVSYQEQNSFNQLIWQLIYARNITSDLERVRAIFLWLCTKDLHQMNFDNVTPGSPEEILMGIRTGKSTYAQIFQILCRYANLHCKLLLGYAKGADYSPGMRFSGAATGQHSWNAVLVDGTWHLVDCHWAARRLIVKRASVENVRYILDTFYFLTNPSQLIYTHFPHDKDWQLLHHPITLEEFETLPLVKSAFFKYNLSLVSHRTAVILFSEPEVRVVIGYPKDANNTFLFTIGLSFDDSELSEHYHNTSLLRYARQEVIARECCVAFYIRPPRPGAYKLLVYAKKRGGSGIDGVCREAETFDTGRAGAEKNLYGAVCEYRLMARTPSNACLPPFPPCQTGTYGVTETFKRFNMVPIGPEASGATIRARNGIAEVRFALVGGSQRPMPRMMGRLHCSLLPEEALDNCILHRVLKSGTEAVITVFLPDAGEFGLEIYASDPERDGSSYFAIWQYLITSEVAATERGLPNLPTGYLGPAARFYELGLQVVSHSDPFIRAEAGELRIQLAYQPQRPLKMMTQLFFASNNDSEDYSQMVLQQMRLGQVYFVIRIPRLGFFKLQIYALPESDRDDSLPGVYNYLIEASKATHRLRGQLMPFPQQFAHWRRSGCYLDAPTEGILGLDASGRLMANPPAEVAFCLAVPSAHSVAVVVDDDWTYLEARGDRWEGTVPMRAHWGRQSRLSYFVGVYVGALKVKLSPILDAIFLHVSTLPHFSHTLTASLSRLYVTTVTHTHT
ncbi:Transglutaminase [Echinococcus multilocularis]|uniref:Transglutaminase n=1 Tax=Echinococcus multilocularis TaxID=6211 RepID=A0A068Y6E9_ECHMU|nr:Transglutaminase [Echinococcus multilocularis]